MLLLLGTPLKSSNTSRFRVSLQECKIIELPKVTDPRGNLTFIEQGRHIPFDIERVYYLYDVPGGPI